MHRMTFSPKMTSKSEWSRDGETSQYSSFLHIAFFPAFKGLFNDVILSMSCVNHSCLTSLLHQISQQAWLNTILSMGLKIAMHRSRLRYFCSGKEEINCEVPTNQESCLLFTTHLPARVLLQLLIIKQHDLERNPFYTKEAEKISLSNMSNSHNQREIFNSKIQLQIVYWPQSQSI